MAVEKETQLEAWLEENMPEPGGGNPNYVETITGTLANPWGSIDVTSLYSAVVSNDATILITATIGEYTVTIPVIVYSALSQFRMSYTDDTETGVVTYFGSYSNDGTIIAFIRAITEPDSGSIDNLASLAAAVPTTLTIIYHPLPEN